ncbi:MAG: zinc ribbon domain-containing protein [Kiritimatiellae bacterium]|nr:zinc ribbon domain-containing protein [Kiritimatiellia bacterium]
MSVGLDNEVLLVCLILAAVVVVPLLIIFLLVRWLVRRRTPRAPKACPACGAAFRPGARFCHECGALREMAAEDTPARKPHARAKWLVGVLIVLLAIMFLAVGLPAYDRARTESVRTRCIGNLRQIAVAKEQWAVEQNKVALDTPSASDLACYIKGGTRHCWCPAARTRSFASSYRINPVGVDPECKVAKRKGHRL